MNYKYEDEEYNVYKYEDNKRCKKDEDNKRCKKDEDNKRCKKDEDNKRCKKDEDNNRCKKDEDKNRCKKEEDGCSKIINKEVSLVAMVKVKPIICVRDIDVKCVGHAHIFECKKHSIKKECEFCIKQDLTIRIPVHFDAETEVENQGIVCHSEEHCHDDEDDDK
jgi:hypothetical protein